MPRTENRPDSPQETRRIILRVFLASIAGNTILGVWALLVDDFGQTQGKVLATSFLVSAAMLAVLIDTPASNRGVLWPAPVVAAAALTIPAVSRFAGAREEPSLETAIRFCPSCGDPVELTSLDGGRVCCERCAWAFEVAGVTVVVSVP